ncbi:hypothetical protein HBZS_118240 [Helicobacter bizzozeronii CCUG 35545]|nr:hypothetical protein HBZS_118240 [Helicobacter bizzozeronii CCUG 35545]
MSDKNLQRNWNVLKVSVFVVCGLNARIACKMAFTNGSFTG